jgi:hypothetical protein
MESWETEIAELLQEAQEIAVMFDIDQSLTQTEKIRAKNNIGIGTTVTNISGDDYKVELW